jgi:tetratricopeptide (TPR) repeat protein
MASEDKMRDLTVQVQRNNSEAQSYLSDLENWQQDMEARDNQLRGKTAEAQTPPTASAKRKGGDDEEKAKEVPKQPKIKAYEYDKWDKFDVDKAIEEVEVDTSSAADKKEQQQLVDKSVLIQQAMAEKERGNENFKAGRYDEAIDCYTRGIKCDPQSAVLVANRAMALLKKNRFESANADATVAVGLDPTYTKAYLRRATARRELGDFEGAVRDFEKVLELEPKNKQAKDELDNTRERERKVKDKESSGTVLEAKKGAPKMSVSFDDNIKAAFSTKKVPVKKWVPDRLEPGQILPISKPPHTRSKKSLKRIEIVEVADVDMEKRTSPEKTAEKTEEGKAAQNDIEKEISQRLETAARLGGDEEERLTKPRSAVQFDKTWRRLSRPGRVRYLRLLAEADYPVIFKHTLEPKTFDEIVAVLPELGEDDSGKHLVGLSKVRHRHVLGGEGEGDHQEHFAFQRGKHSGKDFANGQKKVSCLS